jgi:Tat protein translocase TatB subunit
MFGIGMPELIIILVIGLIVIGPNKLPDLAKAIAKGLAEFKKATQEIKETLHVDEELKEVKQDLADSIAGLKDFKTYDMPEPPPTKSEEKTKGYNDFDQVLEDFNKSGSSKEKKEDSKETGESENAK